MTGARECEPKIFSDYDVEAPIRLDLAARIAFPDGSMGVKGLRKERDAGRLVTEIIANKEYTTLAAIVRMRELCRVRPKRPPASFDGTRAPVTPLRAGMATSTATSSEMSLAAALLAVQKIRANPQPTKRKR